MGRALQVINGQVTNPSSTVTALTANTGDSFTVRNATMGSAIRLADAWCFTTTNLLMRIRSPLLHDVAQNIRLQPVASKAYPLLNGWAIQTLEPQDPLIVELTGGAAEVDAGALLVYYDDLPGANARLFDWAEIKGNVANLFTVEVDVTSSGTSCNYSATVAANGTFDTWRRNIDYALLGYEVGTDCVSVGVTGADTSNLRVGGPGVAFPWITRDWFVGLNNRLGVPCIPVFNSANVGAINVDVVAQATSTVFKIGLHFAQLVSPLAGH